LIEHKAPLISRNQQGDTPLHVAVRADYKEVAEMLRSAGASLTEVIEAEKTTLLLVDPRLATDLKQDYGRKQTHHRPKKQDNSSKKTYRWREVPKTTPAPDQPADAIIQQLRLELAQATEGKRLAEQQYQALQYILDQRACEIEQLRSMSELSFLHIPTQPQSLEQLHISLQRDIQRFEEEVEAWQARASPVLDALVARIRTAAESLWAEAEVHVYGSFAQGLHLPASDLDIVISGCKQDSVKALSRLEALLQTQSYVSTTTLLSSAYIPLLKVQANGTHAVMIDISMAQSQHSGKNCTALVQSYLRRYTVLRPLLLVLKQVLYVFQFHEPFKGGLGSYGLTLMTVFALQQKEMIWEGQSSRSAQALLEVLRFYTSFPFLSPINPTDLPSLLEPDSPPNLPYLLIQDPLNPANNVGRNTSLPQLQIILKACYKSLTGVVSGPNSLIQMLSAARLALIKDD
jgi:predicted nucleotidyltransferase